MLKVVVFASGRGSNLENLINFSKFENSLFKIVGVVSNNKNSNALSIANNNDIQSYHLTNSQFASESEYADKLISILNNLNCELIVLAGYMKIVPIKIVESYKNRIINIHPALLPDFGGEGMYGENVHEAVLKSGKKVSGATVHFVTEEYDKGKIILQETVPILENDTAETLAKRILKIEHKLLPEAVNMFALKKII